MEKTIFNASANSKQFLRSTAVLAASAPEISLLQLGTSVMGTPILAYGLGWGPRRVIFTAGHHANEQLTPLVLFQFMRKVLTRKDLLAIMERNTLCFVPLVNPDGFDLIMRFLTEGEFYDRAVSISKDYPAIPFPDGWKANISGIDLNLQYPTRWEKARELKFAAGFISPAPRDFVGDYPLQAPESAALATFTESFAPELLLALHSQGEVIYYMSNGYYPPGTFPLAQQMADVSGYRLEATPGYSDNAGYKDWFIDRFDKPGFTIELGLGTNPLPFSDFHEIYRRAAPMLMLCALGQP